MPEIIFDNCVLSNFALSESIHVIKALYADSAYITDFVSAENLRGITQGHKGLAAVKQAVLDGWLKEVHFQDNREKRLFEALSVSLGLGEASAIAVAKTRNYVFASDDRAARKEADLLSVKLTGTVGILVKAVRMRVLTGKNADEILDAMTRNGFYSPVATIRSIMDSG